MRGAWIAISCSCLASCELNCFNPLKLWISRNYWHTQTGRCPSPAFSFRGVVEQYNSGFQLKHVLKINSIDKRTEGDAENSWLLSNHSDTAFDCPLGLLLTGCLVGLELTSISLTFGRGSNTALIQLDDSLIVGRFPRVTYLLVDCVPWI